MPLIIKALLHHRVAPDEWHSHKRTLATALIFPSRKRSHSEDTSLHDALVSPRDTRTRNIYGAPISAFAALPKVRLHRQLATPTCADLQIRNLGKPAYEGSCSVRQHRSGRQHLIQAQENTMPKRSGAESGAGAASSHRGGAGHAGAGAQSGAGNSKKHPTGKKTSTSGPKK
jgi:hypothetical protein